MKKMHFMAVLLLVSFCLNLAVAGENSKLKVNGCDRMIAGVDVDLFNQELIPMLLTRGFNLTKIPAETISADPEKFKEKFPRMKTLGMSFQAKGAYKKYFGFKKWTEYHCEVEIEVETLDFENGTEMPEGVLTQIGWSNKGFYEACKNAAKFLAKRISCKN